MKLVFLILAFSAAQAAEFRTVDRYGTYQVEMRYLGGAVTTVQAGCDKSPTSLAGTMCSFDGAPRETMAPCATMNKAYEDACTKKVYDSETTRAVIDQNLKNGLDSLTSAVKDSYRLILTSEEFRRMVREEVQRALAEQAAAN